MRAVVKVGGRRNVLKRFERIEILKKCRLWKEGDRITGLPKTKPESSAPFRAAKGNQGREAGELKGDW